MPIRLCKIALLAVTALFLLLVVFNNVTDYQSNFNYVEHVLSMESTFEGNKAMWRAITSPTIHHLFYWTIILWEAVACALISWGTWKLWQTRGADAATFRRAKTVAIVGLVVSMIQWYLAFLTVGAEWFLMWQSRVWNGQDAAARMFMVMGLILIFVYMKDSELDEA